MVRLGLHADARGLVRTAGDAFMTVCARSLIFYDDYLAISMILGMYGGCSRRLVVHG